MEEKTKQALKFLREVTTQIITLATGTIVLTATLLEHVFPIAQATCVEKGLLLTSWIALSLSVLFGILVFGKVIGELEKGDAKEVVYAPGTLAFGIMQWVSFFVGLGLFVAYVSLNLLN